MLLTSCADYSKRHFHNSSSSKWLQTQPRDKELTKTKANFLSLPISLWFWAGLSTKTDKRSPLDVRYSRSSMSVLLILSFSSESDSEADELSDDSWLSSSAAGWHTSVSARSCFSCAHFLLLTFWALEKPRSLGQLVAGMPSVCAARCESETDGWNDCYLLPCCLPFFNESVDHSVAGSSSWSRKSYCNP